MKAVYSDERGQAAILMALFTGIILLGFAALAVDVGLLYREKRLVQTAADAGAIAAAGQYVNNSGTIIESVAKTAAGMQPGITLMGPPAGKAIVKATLPPGTTNLVQVTVTQPTPTFFMRIFGFGTVNVAAMAEAGWKTSAGGCLRSLSNTGVSSSYIDPGEANDIGPYNGGTYSGEGVIAGNSGGPGINTVGCSICSNSGVYNGGAGISAPMESVTAGTTISGDGSNPGLAVNAPTLNQGAGPSCGDPYANLGLTSLDPTVAFGLTGVTEPTACSTSAGCTLNPGIYNGLQTGNGGTITLTPGMYVITGYFSGGSGTLDGTSGVTLVFAPGANVNSPADDDGPGIQNDIAVKINAPSSAQAPTPAANGIAGIAIWADTGTTFAFNGGGTSTIVGSIYSPNTNMIEGNDSTVTVTGDVITNTVAVGGGSNLTVNACTVNCGSASGGSTGPVTMVR